LCTVYFHSWSMYPLSTRGYLIPLFLCTHLRRCSINYYAFDFIHCILILRKTSYQISLCTQNSSINSRCSSNKILAMVYKDLYRIYRPESSSPSSCSCVLLTVLQTNRSPFSFPNNLCAHLT
jgi:hypothetical protein